MNVDHHPEGLLQRKERVKTVKLSKETNATAIKNSLKLQNVQNVQNSDKRRYYTPNNQKLNSNYNLLHIPIKIDLIQLVSHRLLHELLHF